MGVTSDPINFSDDEKAAHLLFLKNIPYLDLPLHQNFFSTNSLFKLEDAFSFAFHRNSGGKRVGSEYLGQNYCEIGAFWLNIPIVNFTEGAGYKNTNQVIAQSINSEEIYSVFKASEKLISHFKSSIFYHLNQPVLMSRYGYNYGNDEAVYFQRIFSLWVATILQTQAGQFMKDTHRLME
jgi:hypothetical protein